MGVSAFEWSFCYLSDSGTRPSFGGHVNEKYIFVALCGTRFFGGHLKECEGRWNSTLCSLSS
jgi:hypothetical protein